MGARLTEKMRIKVDGFVEHCIVDSWFWEEAVSYFSHSATRGLDFKTMFIQNKATPNTYY
jgi:hypothetical protein